MRTGQRDVHNTPLKRRLSITYEELETLKKSIKVSVLNELRAEMENISDHDSIKDLVLSEIRTELMGIPNPALLKASILNELRMELKVSGENESEAADRKLKELAGIQDGLVRELLDQKMLIKKLETQIGNLTKQLEDAKIAASVVPPSVVSPSISLALPEDPLDLPPLSRKFRQKPEPRKEIEPAELDREEVESKCEYIIAESGDKRRLKGAVRQQPSIRELPRQQSSIRMGSGQQYSGPSFPQRQSPVVRADPVKPQPEDDYKCEYIIAEKTTKKHFIEEFVDVREKEDAELITCSRKPSRAK